MKKSLLCLMLVCIARLPMLGAMEEHQEANRCRLRVDADPSVNLCLPNDLLREILCHADDATVFNSRLACRQLNYAGAAVLSRRYPLFEAAMRNDVGALRLLLASECPVHVYEHGITPLMLALHRGNCEVAEMLEAHGAIKSLVQDLHDMAVFSRFSLSNLEHYKITEEARSKVPLRRSLSILDHTKGIDYRLMRPAVEYLQGKGDPACGTMLWYIRSCNLLLDNMLRTVEEVLGSGLFSPRDLLEPHFVLDKKSLPGIELVRRLLPHDVFDHLPFLIPGDSLSSCQMMRVIWSIGMHLLHQLQYLSSVESLETDQKVLANYSRRLAVLDARLKGLGV